MNGVINKVIPKVLPKIFSSIGITVLAGIKYPPVDEKLLAWIKGPTVDEEDRRDYAKGLGVFPMDIFASHCAIFNGTSDLVVCPANDTFNLKASIVYQGGGGIIVGRYYGQHVLNTKVGGILAIYCEDKAFDSASGVLVSGQEQTVECSYNGSRLVAKVDGIVVIDEAHVTTIEHTDKAWQIAANGNGAGFFTGPIWDVWIGDVHYPLAEGSGASTYSTDGDVGVITTASLEDFWGSTQDVYHYNAVNGFWTNGDGVKYPYAMSGYTDSHLGNTWNGSENKYAFKQDQVGTFDGTSDRITTTISTSDTFDISSKFRIADPETSITLVGTSTSGTLQLRVGGGGGNVELLKSNVGLLVRSATIISVGVEYHVRVVGDINGAELYLNGVLDGSSVYTHTFNSGTYTIGGKGSVELFNGHLSDVEIDGVIVPINEGTGTDIHDNNGNVIGTLTTPDETAFWANQVVPQALIDQDDLEGPYYFSSGTPVPRTQADLEGYCVGKAANFWSECSPTKGLSTYTEILTGSELVEAQDFNCL